MINDNYKFVYKEGDTCKDPQWEMQTTLSWSICSQFSEVIVMAGF